MWRLPFLDRDYSNGPIRDFWDSDQDEIPARPCAYVLIAGQGFTFMYPRRQSSVFYIGQARNLRQRLCEHLRYARAAKYKRKEVLYSPRYEWAATFGARYTYILCRSQERPKRLEEDLLAMFAEHYRAWPLSNGVGSWKRLLTFQEWIRRHKRKA